MLLQKTEQHEESSQNLISATTHSTLSTTFDENKQPLLKSLKFNSELFKIQIHLTPLFLTEI